MTASEEHIVKWHRTVEKKLRKDPELFVRAGRKGGRTKKKEATTYYKDPSYASKSGKKGGAISRRGYKLIDKTDKELTYLHKETGTVEVLPNVIQG